MGPVLTLPSGAWYSGVTVGDFDGDGQPEVAALAGNSGQSVDFLAVDPKTLQITKGASLTLPSAVDVGLSALAASQGIKANKPDFGDVVADTYLYEVAGYVFGLQIPAESLQTIDLEDASQKPIDIQSTGPGGANWTVASVPFDTGGSNCGGQSCAAKSLVFWVVVRMEDGNGTLVPEIEGYGLTANPGAMTLARITDVPIEAYSNNVGLYGMDAQLSILPPPTAAVCSHSSCLISPFPPGEGRVRGR